MDSLFGCVIYPRVLCWIPRIRKKKIPNPSNHLKGNNSKQQWGSQDNDPGLILLKKKKHMLLFILFVKDVPSP